jgi:lipopolysaccharide/colanic/teichoic acid biosynthesis glycosyltransferase
MFLRWRGEMTMLEEKALTMSLMGSRVRATRESSWYERSKVIADRIVGFVLLILFAPVILTVMIVVKLTSRGPALYSQRRVGLEGVPFVIYKIRTMVDECERLSGPQWSTSGDTRVTPVGQFFRRSHLDELPQLVNVVRGEMSLVGPRPERPELIPSIEREIPHYRERLAVRPGVTGLAQVHLPPDMDYGSVERKLRFDLYYVERMSFLLDLQILVATALSMSGIPFSLSIKIVMLPSKDAIDRRHRAASAEFDSMPEVSTA